MNHEELFELAVRNAVELFWKNDPKQQKLNMPPWMLDSAFRDTQKPSTTSETSQPSVPPAPSDKNQP